MDGINVSDDAHSMHTLFGLGAQQHGVDCGRQLNTAKARLG
jgi:hypothetical protein